MLVSLLLLIFTWIEGIINYEKKKWKRFLFYEIFHHFQSELSVEKRGVVHSCNRNFSQLLVQEGDWILPTKRINFELGVHQNFKHVFYICWLIINPYENLIRCIFTVRSLFVWGINILEWNDWYSLFHEIREGIRN